MPGDLVPAPEPSDLIEVDNPLDYQELQGADDLLQDEIREFWPDAFAPITTQPSTPSYIEGAAEGRVAESQMGISASSYVTSHWGELRDNHFSKEPTRLTREAFDEVLLRLAAIGCDDVIVKSGVPLAAKLHGVTYRVAGRNISFEEGVGLLAEIHRESTPAKVRSGEEVNFAYSVPIDPEQNKVLRLRANATSVLGQYGSRDGLAIVLRTIPSCPPTMDDLKVPQDIRDMVFPDSGIILVTGETGSGKTTLIGSFMREAATTSLGQHILTYENPIEFDLNAIPGVTGIINQTEVGDMLPSYAAATPNALRRNPDLILIGESKDRETIMGAVLLAQTGHLVMTTVHTSSVAITIPRMAAQFPQDERQMLMDTLTDSTRGIIHQRLLRRAEGAGRVPILEWLPFNGNVRDALFGAPRDQFIPRTRELVAQYGRTLLEDLELKSDLVNADDYRRVKAELERVES